MSWQEEAQLVYETSSLGLRQAQIAVLTAAGKSRDKIAELIAEHEDDAPTVSTIGSTISKLKRSRLESNTTLNVLNSGFEAVRPPAQLPNEVENDDVTIHAYIGDIGSGLTTTAKSHAYRLHQQHDLDDIIVFDPIEEWVDLSSEVPSIDPIIPIDEGAIDELLSEIQRRPDDAHTLVFIEQAHYVSEDLPELIRSIQKHTSNVSLRMITHTVHDFPDEVTPSIYHFHQSEQPETESKLEEIVSRSTYFESNDPALPREFPEPGSGHPAHVLSAVPETGEHLLRTNVLTDGEQELLLD
jgi:hypothetical protein